MNTPLISKDLIAYLEAHFKNQVPSLQMSDREVWFEAGKVETVKHLRKLYDDQAKRHLQA